MSDDLPSSKLQRGGIIAKTGIRVGARYAAHHLKQVITGREDAEAKSRLHRDNATQVFKEFSRLRGTALKLAQTLSLDNAILPEEVVDVMAQAQYQVPPLNRSLVRRILKQELGAEPEQLFARFEPDAKAAASIGQVHRATLKDGTEVAVKIQYPHVRDTIESDLGIARLFAERFMSKAKADNYFEEVREKLLEETDYLNEGRQLDAYHARFNGDKYATPKRIPELSTGKVLTMTYLDGVHMDAFLKRNPSQEEKDRYGQHFWDFFHDQIDHDHTVYADAHPGNFLFLPDGRLGIVDFGCIKKSPPDFFNNYIRLFDVHMDNPERLKEIYSALEMVDPTGEDQQTEAEFLAFCAAFGDLFLSPYRTEIFDFGREGFDRDVAKYAREATRFTEPRGSRHFIYVTRLHVGMYRILMKLGARVATGGGKDLLRDYLEKTGDAA